VQAVGLDPDRSGLALASRATPLRRLAAVVGPGEPPLAVVARRRLVLALHYAIVGGEAGGDPLRGHGTFTGTPGTGGTYDGSVNCN
jgi:hypothetical protein